MPLHQFTTDDADGNVKSLGLILSGFAGLAAVTAACDGRGDGEPESVAS